jgi:hypothetical protein
MNQQNRSRFGGVIGEVTDFWSKAIIEFKEVMVRPGRFERPTFCSGAIGTSSNPSYRYLGFQQFGASAFAQPTS